MGLRSSPALADRVAAVRPRLFFGKLYGEADPVHVQIPQLLQNALLQLRGGGLPRLGQLRARGGNGLLSLGQLLRQTSQHIVRRLDLVQLSAAAVQIFQHVLHAGAVLLFQPVKLVGAALHLVQLLR